MSCTLTGIIKDCENNRGGIDELWLTPYDNIETLDIQYVDNNIKNGLLFFDIKEDPFVKYDIFNRTINYTVSHSKADTYESEFNHSLTFKVNKRKQVLHKELYTLTNNNRRVVALLKMNNGKYFVLGLQYGLNLQNGDGGSGSISEGTSYNYTLGGIQPYYEMEITEALFNDLTS